MQCNCLKYNYLIFRTPLNLICLQYYDFFAIFANDTYKITLIPQAVCLHNSNQC